MAHGSLQSVLLYVRRLTGQAGAGEEDERLLARYVEQRDDSAFAALVQRHGPMVWAVCSRLLTHPADAEDAFQATFLVLLRKAGALHRRGPLGGWLHAVASRTAAKARS